MRIITAEAREWFKQFPDVPPLAPNNKWAIQHILTAKKLNEFRPRRPSRGKGVAAPLVAANQSNSTPSPAPLRYQGKATKITLPDGTVLEGEFEV